MKGLIGKKVGMTQIYDEQGKIVPVTVIEAGPCVVVDVKTQDRDGYDAVQLGFGSRKAKNVSKSVQGHCAKAGLKDAFPSVLREIRMTGDSPAVGTVLKADVFTDQDYIDVTGITKGRGFQGVVKRHKFGGGRASHGGAWTRRTGSIGCREWPGNIIKGKRMPGHMGNVQRTAQNLKVVRVMLDDNCILVRGAVPGANGGTLVLRTAIKAKNK